MQQLPVLRVLLRTRGPSSRGRVRTRGCWWRSRAEWGRGYLFRGEDEGGRGVAAVAVEDCPLEAGALGVFLSFCLFSAAHGQTGGEVGSPFLVQCA
jgi:hypothetical protein